ncbi:hypothetical protein BC826DRAFT_1018594 [Russula brevipes]|nr:hypothetical protein BC826DRAFT_1018594 [Russula brevipes]
MGLSGRKAKQRIGKDPRNLAWADDASRFGQAYLAKFGWDSSKGLGTSGEGRTTAIRASQKLDMLGIGMQHQNNPDGIAWRQSRDFENLLRRLNEGTNDADAIGSFHKARELESLGGKKRLRAGDGWRQRQRRARRPHHEKEKKRKKEKRKAAEEGPDKKERKKRKKSRDGSVAAPESKSQPEPPPKAPAHESGPGSTPIPAVAAATATATATIAAPVPVPEAEAPMQRLTTSAQSVGDYFKAKLGAKMNMNGAPRPSSALAATCTGTGTGAGASARDDGDGDRDGRDGQRLLLTDRSGGEQVRGGIGASSSRLAAMFMPGGQCATPVAAGEVELVETRDASDGQEDERRKRRGEKKRAKEERRKEKEERRRKRAEAGQVEEAHSPGADDGMEAIPARKQKRGNKDKTSAKHRRPEE